MYYFKSDNVQYKFQFIERLGFHFIDFNSRIYFGDMCCHSINGYLPIQDKKIIWSNGDPANFTPEVKNYMNRILKLMAFT